MNDYSFFTYAAGKKYLEFAFALARSYSFHNGQEIPFFIVSNAAFHLPHDLQWVQKSIVPADLVGKGLEFKLSFFVIAPAVKSIFIDADSLIYGNIISLFSAFSSSNVNVIGNKIHKGSWADEDAADAMAEFNIPYLIRFCGAFYYVNKNETSRDVFSVANQLHQSARNFQKLGETSNEEPMLSIAMAKQDTEPFTDDGNTWGDLAQFSDDTELNIFNGEPEFINNPASSNYKFWLPVGAYRPKILHFGGSNYNKNPWVFDALRLKLHGKYYLNMTLANLLVVAIFKPIYFTGRMLKRMFSKQFKLHSC